MLYHNVTYTPFGMLMPERHKSTPAYRYGFNNMERDDEVKGGGNSYTTFFRQYDPRLGRWLSIDPKANSFASKTPYNGMSNNPIIFIDPNGDADFYNSRGKWIGTDGIDNGNKRMALTKKTAKSIKRDMKKIGFALLIKYTTLNENKDNFMYNSDLIRLPSEKEIDEMDNVFTDYIADGFEHGFVSTTSDEQFKALGTKEEEIDMGPALDEAKVKGQGDVDMMTHLHPTGILFLEGSPMIVSNESSAEDRANAGIIARKSSVEQISIVLGFTFSYIAPPANFEKMPGNDEWKVAKSNPDQLVIIKGDYNKTINFYDNGGDIAKFNYSAFKKAVDKARKHDPKADTKASVRIK